MNNAGNKIPEINLKIETKTVEAKTRVLRSSYVLVTTPYMMLSDKDGTRRVWTRNKKSIILYYLYRITRIQWFIKKYNEQTR
jgi:hypothetical protein